MVHERLLGESFRLHRFLNMGTCSHTVDISFKVRPFAKVDVHAARPAKHGEKIGVSDGELVACQVLFAGKLLVEPVEALAKVLF